MKRNIIYTLVVVLAVCMACTETDITGGEPSAPEVSDVPLRLCVGNLVELQTRGTDTEMQNSTLAAGTQVGVFVMYERDYDSLRIGSSYHNASYYYDNVRCRIEEDGSLHPVESAELFYPMGQDMKIAVFAYAPYDQNMTREALLMPKDGIYVDSLQDSNAAVLKNDLLLGTPVMKNPLRMPISDHTSSPYPSEKIMLNLRHQRTRLIMNLKFSGTPELLDGRPIYHADSVLVFAENVPMSAPLGYSLDTTMINYAVADSLVTDTMLMAVYTDVYVEEAQEKQFFATGIALPSATPVEPSFCIVMVSGEERKYIRRRVTSPVVLERGTSVTFRTTVDSCGEDLAE